MGVVDFDNTQTCDVVPRDDFADMFGLVKRRHDEFVRRCL